MVIRMIPKECSSTSLKRAATENNCSLKSNYTLGFLLQYLSIFCQKPCQNRQYDLTETGFSFGQQLKIGIIHNTSFPYLGMFYKLTC